jgi:glycerol-3-phosphate O-acyltransferase / dihydroxyacetone phosphate acyltransferase
VIYAILRAVSRIALRWFYREIEVVGADRIPQTGPLLVAANHPNALIDALVIGAVVRRRLTMTAKATLLDNPAARAILRAVGIVPLRRAADERKRAPDAPVDAARNAGSFDRVVDVLHDNGAVLIFPEGISHSGPELAPLKTGLARIASRTIEGDRVATLPIVPLGLTFERKWQPRTRILVVVGEPIVVSGSVDAPENTPTAVTARIDAGLRAVTLNFHSRDDAARVLHVATFLSALLDTTRPLHAPDPPLAETVAVVRRVAAVREMLPSAPTSLVERIDRFLERLNAFRTRLDRDRIPANELDMPLANTAGAWFAVREFAMLIGAGPFALWGRINHWVPFRLARALGQRAAADPVDPAMHTVVGGLILVLLFYAAQTAAVALVGGVWWALAYLVSLPLSATWDLLYADRLRRARRRMRTFLLFRRNRGLRDELLVEAAFLREEAGEIERAVRP